jgi:hypothetical protein
MVPLKTKPEVFIIESLDPDDEGNGRFEGSMISHILNLHGKKCKYRYVRTKKQFITAIKEFGESKYRYLHISCHADERSMCTTNQDEIKFSELGLILRPYMAKRRLFVSACKMVNENLVKEVIPHSNCNSVIGPNEKVEFSDAAILWSSLYHLMFKYNYQAMQRKQLLKFLKKTSRIFQVDMSYYALSKSEPQGYSRDLLRKNDPD